MAMAEPKRKKKWSLNPRGTLWSKDENKFGQKLLEKMGWSKGKGLGKNEQGCNEPIKVQANSEQKGVGYKESADSEWTKHCEVFDDILSNLNRVNSQPQDNDSEEVASLETSSKQLRKRVHYQKLTRGKDLSQYNEDDLACVLGSKRFKKDSKMEGKDMMEMGQEVISHHEGNLKEYFAEKMVELKKKREGGLIGCPVESEPNHEDTFPDLYFEPEKMSFSFNVSHLLSEDEPEEGRMNGNKKGIFEKEELSKRKKKKSKRKRNPEDVQVDPHKDQNDSRRKKKKKPIEKENVHSLSSLDGLKKKVNVIKHEHCQNNADECKRNSLALKVTDDKPKKKRRRANMSHSAVEICHGLPEADIVKSQSSPPHTDAEVIEVLEPSCITNTPNDSYCLATTFRSEGKRPTKKMKKLASVKELFRSSWNFSDEAESEPPPEKEKKPLKLSAKKSFKALKTEIESKLKVMRKIYEDKEQPPVNDEVGLNELFPGSNLSEIKGYNLS